MSLFNMLKFKTMECVHLHTYTLVTMEMWISGTSLEDSTFIEYQMHKGTGKDAKAKHRTWACPSGSCLVRR